MENLSMGFGVSGMMDFTNQIFAVATNSRGHNTPVPFHPIGSDWIMQQIILAFRNCIVCDGNIHFVISKIQ